VRGWLYCLLACCWTFSVAGASPNQLFANCSIETVKGQRTLSCQTRLLNPNDIKSVDVTINDKKLNSAKFTPYTKEKKKSAWLFLVDRSNPERAGTVAGNVAFLKSVIQQKKAGHSFGVATFANDLRIVIPLSEKVDDIDKKLSPITADGSATEFFATAIQAIRILKEFNADRKALVILSDGKAEDKAYDRGDVINAARKAGVVIYGIGFAEQSSETPNLQILKRLAEDTYGPFVSAEPGDSNVPDDFKKNFFSFLENGGEIKADLSKATGPVSVNITVQLAEGSSLVHQQSLFVSTAKPSGKNTKKNTSFVSRTFGILGDDAGNWADQNSSLATAILIATGLLILMLLWGIIRMLTGDDHSKDSSQEAATAVIAKDAVAPGRELLGWFEIVDDQTNRFEIFDRSIRIGRHSDNDFQLNNDTVHRHHALFQFLPDMTAVIADLDTVNGVLVNGNRVSKTELASGDLIQLGEVRFRLLTEV